MTNNKEANNKEEIKQRDNIMSFDGREFARLVISELSKTRSGRGFLKSYKQSEVREIIEGYKNPKNQEKLREISQLLFAKSPQYQRLTEYFSGMALFSHIVTPIKDISKLNKSRVLNQYISVSELVKTINLRHEMSKVLSVAFKEDVFYGYIHKSKKDFYIQNIDASLCKITSIEDGVFNYSIDMSYFQRNEDVLNLWANEIQSKYKIWKRMKESNPRISPWVELDAKNTICIKINEDTLDIFPPFAGSFDSIFDIDGFKQLRKDKEELSNYMMLALELPIRKESDNNNDFLIDQDMMMFFHNMASDSVPENVGVITSPMEVKAITFDKDRADSDGVGKATRDFWEGSGTSQLLFNSDKSTSQGLLMGIKTDEAIVFKVLTQIERWLNRYLKSQYSDLLFSVSILHITNFNRKEMFEMYLQAGQYGLPVKNHISAAVGLSPIETMSMSYLENDILELHEKFIPLASSHTAGNDDLANKGRPESDNDEISDEGARGKDKPNS